jgi:hypothetical protein
MGHRNPAYPFNIHFTRSAGARWAVPVAVDGGRSVLAKDEIGALLGDHHHRNMRVGDRPVAAGEAAALEVVGRAGADRNSSHPRPTPGRWRHRRYGCIDTGWVQAYRM